MAKAVEPSRRSDALKHKHDLKMRSAQAFVRGSTALFYRWLAEEPQAAQPPDGPPVWICGDCHLGNLGPIADADGRVEVQIRDLDQTVIGNVDLAARHEAAHLDHCRRYVLAAAA